VLTPVVQGLARVTLVIIEFPQSLIYKVLIFRLFANIYLQSSQLIRYSDGQVCSKCLYNSKFSQLPFIYRFHWFITKRAFGVSEGNVICFPLLAQSTLNTFRVENVGAY